MSACDTSTYSLDCIAEKGNIAAEHAAISGALFGMASSEQVDQMQAYLRSWGIKPSMRNTTIQAILIPLVLLGLIGLILGFITKYIFGNITKHFMTAFAIGMILIGVVYFYYGKAYLKVLMKSTLFWSYCAIGFSIVWCILFLSLFKGYPWVHETTINKMSIFRAVFVETTPLHYRMFRDLFGIERDKHKRNDKIGSFSMWIISLGWVGLILATVILVTQQFHPDLESFITKIEGFLGKETPEAEPEPEAFVDKSSVADATGNAEQVTLVNIQPVSLKQAGFIGPTERGGKFETDTSIINAVRAGVRFFTLQIDYLEKSPGPGFEALNIPTLVYRDNAKAVISTNGASIADVAQKLSIYAFNSDFPTNTQPIILYLHFVRTPNYITKPDAYMKYLSDVAVALAPLKDRIVHGNDSTDFSRQKNERVLLHTPLSVFEGKVIVMTNADTSVFRNAERLSMTPVALDVDLDHMTSMRVYLDSDTDSLGVTAVASEGPAYAVIVSYNRLKGMKEKRGENKQRSDFAMKGKGRFVIAMPGQTDGPSPNDIDNMLTTAGVNTVPTNLFGASPPDIKRQISQWGTTPFYRLKPALLQSTKVAVTGYTPPPNVFV